VLQQWAQALWEASEVVPVHKRTELLRLAAERATSSVNLQTVPMPESACLLGDILVALGEHLWKTRPVKAAEVGAGGAAGEEGIAAREALLCCRRALHESFGKAMGVRSNDLSVVCGLADALLDCSRLQHDIVVCGVDLAWTQPEGIGSNTRVDLAWT
jgi:hypothetical protein